MNYTTIELEAPRIDGRGTAAVENSVNSCPRNGLGDDDNILNQSRFNLGRRVLSDTQPVQAAFIKCKKPIKISTFNARTLRE